MLVMWWVMMIGMMVPSAAPMILIFARVQRKTLPDQNPGLRIALFALGYLLLWLTFSLGATSLQWGLGYVALLSPMMVGSSKYLGPAIFFAAGIYQLTPLKQACLAHCRSPITFLSSYWRNGDWGAFRMGLAHGAYCVGCCWFLMGLLFFGGVMNLFWIAAIAIFVLLEKVLPAARLISRVSGIGMLCFSVFLLSQ
jgi:predicted metal-binding membrane protein